MCGKFLQTLAKGKMELKEQNVLAVKFQFLKLVQLSKVQIMGPHIGVCPMLKFHDLGHMFINQEGKLQSRKVDQQIQREMLSETIIKHNLSYSFVEYD